MQSVILCVDDEPGILDNLKIGLQETFGYAYLIETAQDAEEALALAQDLKNDNCEIPVIISDYIMPGMKGDKLLERIHQLMPKTRTIMLTGQASLEGISNAINSANLYRYLNKPWEPKDFLLTVSEAIDSYSKDKQLQEQQQQLLIAGEELKTYNQTLEQRVADRTRDLNNREKELRHAKEDAEQAKKRAEYANQQKTSFLAMMSHELRTPLNCILGYTEILSRDASLNSEQKSTITVIHESGDHLLTLINDLLDISKIEAGKMELTLGNFNFSEFLTIIAGLLQQSAINKGLQLTMDFSATLLPKYLHADKKRLRQVLLNLLINAIKFTQQGEVSLTIQSSQDRLQFAVHDTGSGIADEDLGKVFLPFQQLKQQPYQMEGTGLGLSITQNLVTLMGGELQVESQEGVGTVFSFSIPLQNTPLEQEGYAAMADLSTSPPSAEAINLIGPNQQQAQQLLALVNIGDIQGIIRLIDELERQTPEISSFAIKLRLVALTYKIKLIRALIEPYA